MTEDEKNHSFALEKYKAELEKWLEDCKHSNAQDIELFKATIQSGQIALRSSILVNGGASIALLTFIGHMATNNIYSQKISQLAPALLCLVLGVLFAMMASGTTYFSQSCYHEIGNKEKEFRGHAWKRFAIFLGVWSYLFFCFRCWYCV